MYYSRDCHENFEENIIDIESLKKYCIRRRRNDQSVFFWKTRNVNVYGNKCYALIRLNFKKQNMMKMYFENCIAYIRVFLIADENQTN